MTLRMNSLRRLIYLVKAGWKVLLSRPWLLPDKVLAYFLARLNRCVRFNQNHFGWLQAILYSRQIDVWERYSSVAREIERLNKQIAVYSILDVGGGEGTVREFINPREYHLHILDIKAEELKRSSDPHLELTAGDGCQLPFKDNSFDVVISVDSLEHVAELRKIDYCRELKRVAKRYVLLRCPADSLDGRFQGTPYTIELFQRLQKHPKIIDFGSNIIEHLECGLPKVEELTDIFQGATIQGKQEINSRLRYMMWERMPYFGFLAGLIYKLALEKRIEQPPYHACLLIWRKNESPQSLNHNP